MKTYVARAMQVSYLTQDQIQRIQDCERRLGYLLANWNIQASMDLPPIREKYHIPEDGESQARHNARIETELKTKGLVKTGEYQDNNIDWFHAFDWNVFHRANEVMWEYQGGKKRGGILARLASATDGEES